MNPAPDGQDCGVGLPARIALPILAVFAVVFLGILGWFLRIGFGTTGSAFGPGAVSEQGDARIQATPAPIATDPPGTFTVPQTGTGPIAGSELIEKGVTSQFTQAFFLLTGFHGSHVLSGLVILIITAIRTAMGKTGAQGVEMAGLYWHFVDLVWVFIFTLFYLL